MSALGQKQTFLSVRPMSALPPKAGRDRTPLGLRPLQQVGSHSYFQSFHSDIACDLKIRKLAVLHFTGESSPSNENILLAHRSVPSLTPCIHLRQLNTVAL